MNERLCRGLLLVFGVAGIAAATFLGASDLRGQDALGCCVVVLLYWLLGAMLLLRKPLFRRLEHTVCAVLGLYMCLFLRLSLFDYVSPDYVSFLGPWSETMRSMTVRQALVTPIGDYNMPYLYLLLILSRIPVYDLYGIKLISVLSDVFLALGLGRLAAETARRERPVLLAFFAGLLAPTILFNSAYWGQCDGIYACFSVWGLYYGLKKRPVLSMVFFAFAFSFKLQAVFILPVIAFLLVKEKLRLRDFVWFPVTFLGVMLPALLAGRSLSDTFGIYLNQTNAYPYLSLNAPSMWSLIPNDFFSRLDETSVLLAGIVTLLLLYGFLRRCGAMEDRDLIPVGLIFTLAIPWLLPCMHERYFYLAECLSILYLVRYPHRIGVPVVILGGGFLAYCSYLFGGMRILSNELVAVAYGLTLLYLIVKLLRETDARMTKKEVHVYE